MPQPNILEYLPDIFKNIREMKAYADAEKPELEKLWKAVDDAYNDQFLYTMTENGIKRWEKILKISPMGTDTLDDRRFRIINRYNIQLPYTYRMLEAHLQKMCGKDGYVMSYNKETWTLSIKIALTSKKQYQEILNLVNQMIPANIILEYGLLYNTHEILSAYTHEQLSAYTHESLRSEVMT